MNKEIFKFLRENYGWMVALTTGLSIILSFLLRFIKYVCSYFYFSYYGLSYELFNMNDLGFFYDFCISILILLCFYSLMYCYIQLFNIKKYIKQIKIVISNALLILISNIVIMFFLKVKIDIFQIILYLFILLAVEFISALVIFKMSRQQNVNYDKVDILNNLKILPFFLIMLLFILLFSYGSVIINDKSYRIIDDTKVIVYASDDYYLILECEIKNNELIIYRGNQTKISNENVESRLISFDDVRVQVK